MFKSSELDDIHWTVGKECIYDNMALAVRVTRLLQLFQKLEFETDIAI